jgi:hypothetical protein
VFLAARFRTEKRRAGDGRPYPWIVRATSVVNQFCVPSAEAVTCGNSDEFG